MTITFVQFNSLYIQIIIYIFEPKTNSKAKDLYEKISQKFIPVNSNIRVFVYITDDWQQKGSTINEDYEEAAFGIYTDINADGAIIAG